MSRAALFRNQSLQIAFKAVFGLSCLVCTGQQCVVAPDAVSEENADEQVLGSQPEQPPWIETSTPENTETSSIDDSGPFMPDVPPQTAGTVPPSDMLNALAEPQVGLAPLSVSFSVSSILPLPEHASYSWTFGDGFTTVTAGPACVHIFQTPGAYTNQVCLAAPDGSSSCVQCEVVVQGGDSSTTNRAPLSFGSDVQTEIGKPVAVILRGGDPDQDLLSIRITGAPSNGSLSDVSENSPGVFATTYQPDPEFIGLDRIKFVVSDGSSDSNESSIIIAVLNAPVPPALISRQAQWPLKREAVLYPTAQMASARQFCASDRRGANLKNNVEESAAPWLEKSEEELRALLPDARVPRAIDVGVSGCPIHGSDIYRYGTYPWILDSQRKFGVICPVGGERYPSNDFDAYYRDGLRDFRLLSGAYVDSGRGWVGPGGEKFWFVGYACHWNWKRNWLPAVTQLSQAYALTGDRRYARRAIAMLDRIAEVYPAMDYDTQSRFGELYYWRYPGKILQRIWEANVLRDLAIAYDLVFDALVGPNAESMPWRSADQIRANIEANLLEEGLDSLANGNINGDFGMNQSALVHAVLVRQSGITNQLLGSMFTSVGGTEANEGLNYALYNLVFKDGMPNEGSPFYSSGWVNSLSGFAGPLRLTAFDLYQIPKMDWIYQAPLSLICAGRFTPAIGDAGSLSSGWIIPDADAYEAAYRALGGEANAWALRSQGGPAAELMNWQFKDVFRPQIYEQAVADAARHDPRQQSRFLDGVGVAILNNDADTAAVAMHYGIRGGHGHKDSLNIELFGNQERLSPDLGYPDSMNGYISGIYSWTQNTVSHNCVVVDDKMQDGTGEGTVNMFVNAPTVHFADAESRNAYQQVDQYRRQLLLVDVGPGDAYLVDVFRVRGGQRHVLSIHGPPGEFSFSSAALTPAVTEGTLAGPQVPYGQCYDDPVLGALNYTGVYLSYHGSGYQHLFNWQKAMPSETALASWSTNNGSTLSVHVPPVPGQELIAADAYVSPRRIVPTMLKYLLVSRSAETEGNTFVTVWELASNSRFIDEVQFHNVAGYGSGSEAFVSLSVRRGDTIDTIGLAASTGTVRQFSTSLPQPTTWSTDAAAFLVSERGGQWSTKFTAGGAGVSCSRPALKSVVAPAIRGNIAQLDFAAKTVTLDRGTDNATAAGLIGRTVRMHNEDHSCVYRITSAGSAGSNLVLTLGGSDVYTGRILIDSVDYAAGLVRTRAMLPFPSHLIGMTLATSDQVPRARIVQASAGALTVQGDCSRFKAGDDALITDFGIGDQAAIEMSTFVAR